MPKQNLVSVLEERAENECWIGGCQLHCGYGIKEGDSAVLCPTIRKIECNKSGD